MASRGDKITLSQNDARAIDAYWEYSKIVGNDDNGVPFTPEQYENYKREVLPMRIKNRVYVSWVNSSGMDCTLIGPETMCFCQHRFKQHQTDFKELPKSRPILLPCEEAGCRCSNFTYAPKNGTQPIRCGCKHTTEEHKVTKPFNCIKNGCKCTGFKSSFTCNCGEPCYGHETLAESKEEREARGHPVGQDVPFKAMGGLTGFSSLAEGYLRLDPSGRGRPSDEFFDRQIESSDHPFLRQFAHKEMELNSKGELELSKNAKASMRQSGESELDFYERRYQERMKAERSGKPKPIQSSPYDDTAKLTTGLRNSKPQKKF